jgi:hypothetical protein
MLPFVSRLPPLELLALLVSDNLTPPVRANRFFGSRLFFRLMSAFCNLRSLFAAYARFLKLAPHFCGSYPLFATCASFLRLMPAFCNSRLLFSAHARFLQFAPAFCNSRPLFAIRARYPCPAPEPFSGSGPLSGSYGRGQRNSSARMVICSFSILPNNCLFVKEVFFPKWRSARAVGGRA